MTEPSKPKISSQPKGAPSIASNVAANVASGNALPPTNASQDSPRPWKLYGSFAFAVVLAGLLVWQIVGNAQTKRAFKKQRAEMAAAHASLQIDQAEQLLRTSGSLLAAAIHGPLAAGDFETIETVIKALVVERQIELVAVADQNGIVRISTNHKLEGQTLSEAFPGVLLEPAVVVTKHEASLVVATPVVDSEQTVGHAVISFALP